MKPLISTVAAPNSNSYLSWDEVDEIMSTQDPEWGEKTENEKYNIATGGAQDIDRLRFIGQPCYPTQKRAFPRYLDIHVDQKALTDGTRILEPASPVIFVKSSEVNPDYVEGVWWSRVIMGYNLPEKVQKVKQDDGTWKDEMAPVYLSDISVSFMLAGNPYSITVSANESTTRSVEGAYLIVHDAEAREFVMHSFVEGAYCRDCSSSATAVDYERVTFTDAILDQTAYFPDAYKFGSVHVVYSNGARTYHDIIEHNIVTGVVRLATPFEHDTVVSFLMHKPIAREVREAQVIQMLVRAGALEDYDPFVGGGIARIKIGDSERDYSAPRYGGLGIRELASRNRVSEQVFVLIGHYTTYGKFGVTWEAERADVYAGATSESGT